MVYRGHVANGVIRLEGSAILPDGAEVRVELTTDPKDEEFRAGIEQELDRLALLPANWDHEGALRIDAAIIRAARLYIGRLPPNISQFPQWSHRRQAISNSNGARAADLSNWKSKIPRRSTISSGTPTRKLKKKTFSALKTRIARSV